MERLKDIEELKSLRKRIKEETFKPDIPRIRICSGTACTASGTPKVVSAIEEEAGKKGIKSRNCENGLSGILSEGAYT